MNSKPYLQRLAELWVINRGRNKRALTGSEAKEFEQCLDILATDMFREAYLFNLSLCAAETNDKEWQFEICRMIDEANL